MNAGTGPGWWLLEAVTGGGQAEGVRGNRNRGGEEQKQSNGGGRGWVAAKLQWHQSGGGWRRKDG